MTRDVLERRQVWLYLAAVVVGLTVGTAWPAVGTVTEHLVWPVLALLLFATFAQMPLAHVPAAFRDGKFLATALFGNFVVMPVVVWGLVQFVPDDAPLRLGLLLVLLVPCTDWFITFSQLGGGDAGRATALTPITLLAQLMLLPIYLVLIVGDDVATALTIGNVWPAALVVLGPLGLAAVAERWASGHPARHATLSRTAWLPVPLLAVVILLVATTHVPEVQDSLGTLPIVGAIATAYLLIALGLAKALSAAARLPVPQGRTLAFSLGTRNSFIVLPLALSLPAGWEVAAVVVVTQSLVELFGMIFYLQFVPRVLFPDKREP